MARACLAGPPRDETPQALAAFGLDASAIDGPHRTSQEPVEIWPDQETPFNLFRALQTQWRMGMGGPVGLDYTALPLVAGVLRIGRRACRLAFSDLQVMEAEALAYFAEQAKRGAK